VTVVVVSGEIDVCTAPALARQLDQVAGPGVVLDVSGVRFLDAAGLRVLESLEERLRASGGQLVLAAVPRPVRRIVEIIGIDRRFRQSPTLDGAMALLPGSAQPGATRASNSALTTA